MSEKATQPTEPFENMEGSELFRPVATLRASQRVRLAARAMALASDDDWGEVQFEALADLLDFLEDGDYILDPVKWSAFYEEKGLGDVLKLAVTYAGEAAGAKQ